MANGLPYFDDPDWTPMVAGLGGTMVPYTPVSADEMHDAVYEAVVDRHTKKDTQALGTSRKKIYAPAALVLGLLLKQSKEVSWSPKPSEIKYCIRY